MEVFLDVDQARTFLAVAETGSFVAAAERVFVTQSTVSMRIKALEDRLGRRLFERGKHGAALTPAGLQFQPHAAAIMRIWEKARLDVGLPDGFEEALSIGGQISLWEGFLLNWLPWMQSTAPSVAIKTSLGYSNAMLQSVSDGLLDLAIIYRPEARPGLKTEQLFEERLVRVSSEQAPQAQLNAQYVFINWGPEFQADHALSYPDFKLPPLFLDIGGLALSYLLANEASGYLPLRLAAPFIEAGQLSRVPESPVFSYPVYAVYSSEENSQHLDTALSGLREIAERLSA